MNTSKFLPCCIAYLSVAFLAPRVAQAVALTGTIYDGFNYTTANNAGDDTSDGDVGGNTGGVGWGATPSAWSNNATTANTSAVLNITTPGLLYAGLLTGADNALNLNAAAPVGGTANTNQNFFRAFNQAGVLDAGTVYFSFLVRKDAESQRTINVAFFNGGAERLAIGQFSPAATYSNGNFGFTQNTTAAALVASGSPIAFTLGATFLVVGKIEFNVADAGFSGTQDRVSLFINPAPGDAEPVTAYIQTTSANSIDLVAIDRIRPFVGNASGAQAGPPAVPALPASVATFDEIRLGPTFASVTPVPEPQSIALLAIASVGFVMRRRRA